MQLKTYQQDPIDKLLKRLCSYIQKENKKGRELFGGIVANTDPHEYKDRWVYFDKSSKELKNNFANWENLGLWKFRKLEENYLDK